MKKIFLPLLVIAALSESAFADLERAFIDLGKKANPAVVNIFTTQVIKNSYGGRPGFSPMPMDPFQQFMEQFMGGGMGALQPQEQRASSLGSGFIIDDSGLILTNNHVIQNATEISIQLTEKSKKVYKAKVIGTDARTDIAVIKISYQGKLTTLPLGDSDKVEVGQWVAAFGNPFGHGHSMTKGIISSKDRDVDLENAPQFPFLQTDASINPGNSGGPLVNLAGEVIGVNSAIDARAQGIGFAIPINAVKKILPELKTKGKITRGYLGVTITDVDEKVAKEFGLKSEKGAFVTGVAQGSPADTGGIEPYDVIVNFDGRDIDTARTLMGVVADSKIGGTVSAQVVRNGKVVNLNIAIKERGDQKTAQGGKERRGKIQGQKVPNNVGLEIADLNSFLAREMRLPPQVKKGVIIVGVAEGSLAEYAGLRPGDLILDVNKVAVNNTHQAIAEFQKNFKKGSGAMRSLRILRGVNTMVVFMEIE